MKSTFIFVAKVTIVLMFFVCSSSVVYCVACKQHGAISTSTVQEEDINTNYKQSFIKDDCDVSPLSLGSMRLSELL
jgi:hypothetical protein